MHNRGLTLIEAVAIVVVVAVLAALLLPPTCGGGLRRAKLVGCASNLHQLYKLGTLYAATHRGEWPEGTGENLWVSFAKTTPPLIPSEELGLFSCPVRDEELGAGKCDYLGPIKPFGQLKPDDPLGADKEGNHGEGQPINVLFKDGSVLDAAPLDALWKKCRTVLSP